MKKTFYPHFTDEDNYNKGISTEILDRSPNGICWPSVPTNSLVSFPTNTVSMCVHCLPRKGVESVVGRGREG